MNPGRVILIVVTIACNCFGNEKSETEKVLKFHDEHVAICEMSDSMANGTITIVQEDNNYSASFHFQFKELAHRNNEFEFHVHQFGDLSDNCKKVGGNYSPNNYTDAGDLGKILSNQNGSIIGIWKNDTNLTMLGEYSILGRSVVVHDAHDHVACCIIGWSSETHHHHDENHSHSHDHSDHDHDRSTHNHTAIKRSLGP